MEDKFALTERILRDIHAVMSKNTQLSMFDIVPVEKNTINRSPVIYSENCMGLESWCIKHVYMTCYSELMEKLYLNKKSQDQKLLPNQSERLTKLLTILLLINPDVSLLWNRRRELCVKKMLSIYKELQFSKLVLSRKPKCNEAFAYRRWLLSGLFKDSSINHNLLDIVNEELDLCTSAAERSSNNYHSWSHRIWLFEMLKSNDRQLCLDYLLTQEYAFSKKWASIHVSDFSCFHYRQFCIHNINSLTIDKWKKFEDTLKISLYDVFIKFLLEISIKNVRLKIGKEQIASASEDTLLSYLFGKTFRSCKCNVDLHLMCKKFQLLFYELLWNEDLVKYYEHHESLWYHRRFIINEILSLMYSYFNLTFQDGVLVSNCCNECCNEDIKKQAKVLRYDNNNLYSCLLFIIFVNYEKEFIENRKLANDNYAFVHERYLKFVKHLKNVI